MREQFEHYQGHSPALENAALPSGAVMRYTGRVRDIAEGVKLLHELWEWQELRVEAQEDEDTSPPLLGATDLGILQRLTIASLDLLAAESARLISWAEEHHALKG